MRRALIKVRLPATALCILLLAAARPVAAQCRVSEVPGLGMGALDRGRAIVSSCDATGIPVVRFYDKTVQGWTVQDESIYAGLVVYPVAVAIDGDRALVGCAEANAQDGRATVFDRVGAAWLPTELVPASPSAGDFFGAAVRLDGDVAVVGAEHWPMGGGDGLSRVHVFEFDGTSWTETAQLTDYGRALDVDGDTIVVGDDSLPGHVKVYERIGGLWVWTDTLSDGAPPPGFRFGSSLALQGDTLVAGARAHSSQAGRVEVFRRQGTQWVPVQTIVPNDSSAGDDFGYSVAISGGTLLVGAPDPGGSGRVYRFDHDGTSFVQTGRFGPERSSTGFGFALAVQREDAILAGSHGVDFYRLGFAEADSFCPATPNSTGARGVLAAEGCDSRAGERLSLVAKRLPQGVFGFTFFGLNTTQLPFGDGTLCIGAPRFRLPAAVSDTSGTLVHDVDFGSRPGSSLAAGRTWKFQTAFRDPGSAGSGLNLTNALAIGITP